MWSVKKMWFTTPILVLIGSLGFSETAYLRCYQGSLNNYVETPLSHPLKLIPCINKELPTVIYTFGYRGKISGPATTAVLTAYINKKKRNVILLNWENEAESGMFGISLGYAFSAIPNAKKIGRELGQALIDFTKAGVAISDIHLVAHSLGAHLMGFAGRLTREQGYVVPRITGLDPAGTLFEGPLSLHSGLDRTCAKFVDIIHTDLGNYGSSTSTGTVDIWPNYTGEKNKQPGCPIGNFEMFSPEDLCSHDRSWGYFVEALAWPTSFQAVAASNYSEWVAHGGESNRTIYLGDLTSTQAKGNYYLRTNSKSPFGLGVEGTKPITNQTRRRRNPFLARLFKFF
ncbi:phospholipase A1-like [Spodoptera litura]|uniref:Phospholipase A1-like n=1 Tax=Spodoptera litura TaxID=69820 RepID=A0A9J7IHT3_SPOLT|nr:phospholipase A1-like [Spodoptera litura]